MPAVTLKRTALIAARPNRASRSFASKWEKSVPWSSMAYEPTMSTVQAGPAFARLYRVGQIA
jgi:hypothetical protein